MPGGIVKGHKIVGETEYELAVKEAEMIDSITSDIDMSNPEALEKLYRSMQSGEISFSTVVGREFDDYIYDQIQKLRRGSAAAKNGSDKTGSSKKNKVSGRKSNNISGASNSPKPVANSKPASSSQINKSLDEAAEEILKKANRRRSIIIAFASVIAVCSFVYFIIYSKSAYNTQKAYDELAALKGTEPIAEEIEQKPLFTLAEAEEIPDILDEYKNIYLKNKSIIGWLSIEDTNIDYPVMQTVNNEYYLSHNFEGKEDNNGALFMDCNCNGVFRSTNLIIYGHHMKSGKMFGGLKKYASEDYCKAHNTINFDTIYEKSKYEVMYVFKADISNAEDVSFKYYQFIDAASEVEFESNMKTMSEMSLYDTGVTAIYGDELLTLSTCDGSASTTRFVVVAKRIDK